MSAITPAGIRISNSGGIPMNPWEWGVIQRRNKRSGKPIEGTMKVIEFEPNRVMGMEIHDGPAVMYGRTTFEPLDQNRTKLTTIMDIPWMDENTDRTFLNSRLESAAQIRKNLMETEL